MINARPNQIPQYKYFSFTEDQPRADAMKFKQPHEKFSHSVKLRPKLNVLPLNPLSIQRNPMDQSLPSMSTPFDLRFGLSKLGGIPGFYGSSTQNGKPLYSQKGIGKDNLLPRKPLLNSNF